MGKIRISSMKKKGIFFTFIAITLMVIFVWMFSPQAEISLQKDTQAMKTRIGSLDNYVNDLESRYFEAVLRAATHKAILSLIFYMNETGSYITNFDSVFYEVALNGSILNAGEHVPIDSITGKKIMDNNTILNWSNKIAQASKDALNVNTSITVVGITISQTKPWSINSTLTLNFSVKSNVAEWNKANVSITTTTGIEGFYDPYYLLIAGSGGLYANPIKKSSVDFDKWDIDKVREHLRNGTYVHWQNSDAPSFLMRFTITIAPSDCCGIESLVNPNKVTPTDQLESYVDYLFWTHTYSDCTKLWNINGLSGEFPSFKLDLDHVTKYNIIAADAAPNCP